VVGISSGASSFGQNVLITATVGAAVGTPTGSVTLKDGTNVLATIPLTSGIATFSSSTLAVGAHSFTIAYSGTNSFGPSESGPFLLSVSPTATTTTLSVPTSTPGVDQPLTIVATVSPDVSGAASPTGTVVFHDGTAVLGTRTLANGQAAITVALSGIGSSHVITASYSGSDGYQASASGNQTVTVVQATPTTALFATVVRARRKVRGVTLQVIVEAESSGGPVPTGTVTFDIGRRKLRSVVVSNGTASVFLATRQAQGKNFVVDYSGDSDYKAEASNTIHLGPKFFK
jgi:large repetitive protein